MLEECIDNIGIPQHGTMSMEHDLPPFALLIDADNVRQDGLAPILEEITRHARVTVRRIYGDFTTPHLAGWRLKLADHAIQPIQQYRNTVGKNASDSALIIDAMDLLHSRRFKGFCLVSSDSDFTRLATRIREDGLTVFGFGEKHAPKAFVSACDRYIYVENLIARSDIETNNAAAPTPEAESPAPPPAADTAREPNAPPPVTAANEAETQAASTPGYAPPSLAVNILMRAYTNVADDLGWAMLSQMSTYIHANHPDFDPRTYGCTKFIELVQKTEAFAVELRLHKNGQVHFCHPRNLTARARQNIPSQVQKGTDDAFRQALLEAVASATGDNGWASISTIGQKLKASGHVVKGSGHSTLSDALAAISRLETKGKGAARYFRLKPVARPPSH